MFWFNIVKSFINILREGQTPAQVAGGFALGTLVGFSPMVTLQGLVVWLVILVLDVNFAAVLLALTLCKLIAYLIDPIFHSLGFAVLVKAEFLQGLWTWLYNAPIAPLTRFNNTVVMGSFLFAIICFVPVYIGMKRTVVAYRTHIHSRFEQWKVYKMLDKSKLVNYYRRIRDWKG
ncbi:MAG: TIGR03546 family protein [Bacteroidota bacterium]